MERDGKDFSQRHENAPGPGIVRGPARRQRSRARIGANQEQFPSPSKTLVSCGFAQSNGASGKYAATLKLWELGSQVLAKVDIKNVSGAFLQALADKTGETVHLSVFIENVVIYIDKIDSPQPVRAYSQIGKSAPAYCVATGKVLLAFQEEDVIADVCRSLEQHTSRTITDPEELQRELARIRQTGYAINRGEWREGVCGVGAPIRDSSAAGRWRGGYFRTRDAHEAGIHARSSARGDRRRKLHLPRAWIFSRALNRPVKRLKSRSSIIGQSMNGPLTGIRVLEFAQIAAGPFAGSLFADLGADVVKVERPDGGDGMRNWPPAIKGDGGAPVSGNFTSVNRNKRSITIDVKNPEDMKRFYALVATADLFVENYRPGVPEASWPWLRRASQVQPADRLLFDFRIWPDRSLRREGCV